MEKTITNIVGIVVAVVAFGIIIYWIPQSLFDDKEEKPIVSNVFFVDPYIIITWETENPHQGYVYYADSGSITGRDRETDFTKAHRVRINTTKMTGIVTYHIESCPLHGECQVEAERTYP